MVLRDQILIVGLGNPGKTYESTRHNAGFMAIDRLAEKLGASFTSRKFSALYADARFEGKKIHLLKPQSFMNLSGQSVLQAAQFYQFSPQDIWVIHDDLDLSLGDFRLKSGGGHGGHNGLRSILNLIATGEFLRFRIGIGRPNHADVVNYVLTSFSVTESIDLDRVLDLSTQAIILALREGVTASMNYCNGLYKAKKKEEAKGE